MDNELRQAVLEVLVAAALAGHDLGPFEPADTINGGYEARCRRCDRTVWVSVGGLIYSLLGDVCGAEH